MNNNDDGQYINHNASNPRVIEIPVQHFSSSNNNSNGSSSLPKHTGFNNLNSNNSNGFTDKKHHPDFFNRNNNNQGIFDDFHQSPFDLVDSPIHRNRSLFNREQPFGSRFDEFFRPNLTASPHHSSAEQFLNRKSPNRDILRQTSPAPESLKNSERSQNRQSPVIFRTESPKLRTESPSHRLNQSSIQIPIVHGQPVAPGSDFRLRTESPTHRQSPSPSASKLAAESNKQPSPPLQTEEQLKKPIVLPEPPQNLPKQVHSDPINNTGINSDFIKKNNHQNQKETSPGQPTTTTTTKPKYTPKPNPVINLPKVIPLPEPQHHHEEKKTEPQQQNDESKNMGNTFQGQGSGSNKRHAGASDFAQPHQSSPHPEFHHQHIPPQPAVKTQKEKLEDIAIELEQYQNELTTLKPGCGKKDKLYLKLDEFLTRCLLKLDEIEKTDDIVHQRKSLIVASNKLLDQLESIALESNANNEIDNQDLNEPRSKSPKIEANPERHDSEQEESKSDEAATVSAAAADAAAAEA